jgi:hypothetical protein
MIETAKGLFTAARLPSVLRPDTASVSPLRADSNGMPAAIVAAPSTATTATTAKVGIAAPYCYRVSVLSDSIEVSARLKTADDLELLVRVLEANRVLFAKTEISAKTHQSALSAHRSEKVKADQLVDRSEPDILTLT